MKRRLGILVTHPIQYHAPWFRALSATDELEIDVFFAHKLAPSEQSDAGFGIAFDWDRPLLEGYSHRFLRNVAANPSVHRFAGLNTPEVGDVIRRGGYDAFLINGWNYLSAWQAVWACQRTGTPILMRSDSNLRSQRHPLRSAVKFPLYRFAIPRLDACLAVGTWSREYFVHYGARPDHVFTVPHIADYDYFESEGERLQPVRATLREGWGLPHDAIVFLFVGRFVDFKRPMDFVQAVQQVSGRNGYVAGLMVGDGPLRAEVEQFMNRHRTPVGFAGFLNQSRLPAAYAAADALVLPSTASETWGIVVNEAMISGRPAIVSSGVGSGPDLVVPGQTGDIYPVTDVHCLAALMDRYASDPALLRQMGARSKEHVRSQTRASIHGVMEAMARTRGK